MEGPRERREKRGVSSRRYACSQSEQEAGKWSHFLFCQVAILQQWSAQGNQGNKSLGHERFQTPNTRKTKLVFPYHNGASSHSNRLGFRDLLMETSKSLGIISSVFPLVQSDASCSVPLVLEFTLRPNWMSNFLLYKITSSNCKR